MPPKREDKFRNATIHDKLLLQHTCISCLSGWINRFFFFLLIYLLTPWSRANLEKLTGSHLVLKFPAFYGTGRFITVFRSSRQLSLSWVRFWLRIYAQKLTRLQVLQPACHLPILTVLQKTLDTRRDEATSWQDCAIQCPTSPSQHFFFTLIEHHLLFGRIRTYSRGFLGSLSRIRFSVATPFVDLTIFCSHKNMKNGTQRKRRNFPKNLEDEKVKCCQHLIGFLIKIKSNLLVESQIHF